jgi:hypothetical protein
MVSRVLSPPVAIVDLLATRESKYSRRTGEIKHQTFAPSRRTGPPLEPRGTHDFQGHVPASHCAGAGVLSDRWKSKRKRRFVARKYEYATVCPSAVATMLGTAVRSGRLPRADRHHQLAVPESGSSRKSRIGGLAGKPRTKSGETSRPR